MNKQQYFGLIRSLVHQSESMDSSRLFGLCWDLSVKHPQYYDCVVLPYLEQADLEPLSFEVDVEGILMTFERLERLFGSKIDVAICLRVIRLSYDVEIPWGLTTAFEETTLRIVCVCISSQVNTREVCGVSVVWENCLYAMGQLPHLTSLSGIEASKQTLTKLSKLQRPLQYIMLRDGELNGHDINTLVLVCAKGGSVHLDNVTITPGGLLKVFGYFERVKLTDVRLTAKIGQQKENQYQIKSLTLENTPGVWAAFARCTPILEEISVDYKSKGTAFRTACFHDALKHTHTMYVQCESKRSAVELKRDFVDGKFPALRHLKVVLPWSCIADEMHLNFSSMYAFVDVQITEMTFEEVWDDDFLMLNEDMPLFSSAFDQ